MFYGENPYVTAAAAIERKRKERDDEAERFEKMRKEAEERERQEAHERRLRQIGPAAPPIPLNAQKVRDGQGIPGVDYDPRFPPMLVTNLPDPAPRDAGGNLPWEDASISEADRIKAYKTSPQRIDALERRIAELEGKISRYFGGAGNAGGEGYR